MYFYVFLCIFYVFLMKIIEKYRFLTRNSKNHEKKYPKKTYLRCAPPEPTAPPARGRPQKFMNLIKIIFKYIFLFILIYCLYIFI